MSSFGWIESFVFLCQYQVRHHKILISEPLEKENTDGAALFMALNEYPGYYLIFVREISVFNKVIGVYHI